MSSESSEIRFIAWDLEGHPVYAPTLGSVARWAQLAELHRAVVWHVDHQRCLVEQLYLERHGAEWHLVDEATGLIRDRIAASDEDARVVTIVQFIEDKLGPMVDLKRVGLDDWEVRHPDDPLRVNAPIGLLPSPDRRRLAYCPELIAAQTVHLADPHFEVYLQYILMRVAIGGANRDLSPSQLEENITSMVFSMGLNYQSIVNDVHQRVIVPRD